MLNDVAKEWVKALRSGDYEQGKFALRTRDNKFCCLGVLCDLAHEAGVIESPVKDFSCYSYAGQSATAASPIRKWAGLDDAVALIVANDREGKTFAEIADLIESEPVGLFV